jgi:hypothetical protein
MEASSSSTFVAVRDENALKKLSFNDPAFLSHFGLSGTNILDYFYGSPFYDANCCNQALRMQGASLDNLKGMTGVQYQHDFCAHEPQLFRVKKVHRESPTRVHPLETYYCLDGTFYQSPDLYEIVTTRSKKISAFMKESFRATEQGSAYTSADGHVMFRDADGDAERLEAFDFVNFPSITSLLNDVAAVAASTVYAPPASATDTADGGGAVM